MSTCWATAPAGCWSGGADRNRKFDEDVVIEACRVFDTALEINCRPERLDPPRDMLRKAADAGINVAISTDAHAATQLDWQTVRHRTAPPNAGDRGARRQRVGRRRSARVVRRAPGLTLTTFNGRPISQWCPNGSAMRPILQPCLRTSVDDRRARHRRRARTRRPGRRPRGSSAPTRRVRVRDHVRIGLDPEVGGADPQLRDLQGARRRRCCVLSRPHRTPLGRRRGPRRHSGTDNQVQCSWSRVRGPASVAPHDRDSQGARCRPASTRSSARARIVEDPDLARPDTLDVDGGVGEIARDHGAFAAQPHPHVVVRRRQRAVGPVPEFGLASLRRLRGVQRGISVTTPIDAVAHA